MHTTLKKWRKQKKKRKEEESNPEIIKKAFDALMHEYEEKTRNIAILQQNKEEIEKVKKNRVKIVALHSNLPLDHQYDERKQDIANMKKIRFFDYDNQSLALNDYRRYYLPQNQPRPNLLNALWTMLKKPESDPSDPEKKNILNCLENIEPDAIVFNGTSEAECKDAYNFREQYQSFFNDLQQLNQQHQQQQVNNIQEQQQNEVQNNDNQILINQQDIEENKLKLSFSKIPNTLRLESSVLEWINVISTGSESDKKKK